jgi:hypothetical protein
MYTISFTTTLCKYMYDSGDRMDERCWIRFLPWGQRNGEESKSPQIKYAPQLMITPKNARCVNYILLILI